MPSPPLPPEVIRLRLFVAGDSPRSANAMRNLERLGTSALSGRYEIEIVDVLADPARAEEDHVLATPTLLRVSPGPRRRIVGDLADLDVLVKTLAAGGASG